MSWDYGQQLRIDTRVLPDEYRYKTKTCALLARYRSTPVGNERSHRFEMNGLVAFLRALCNFGPLSGLLNPSWSPAAVDRVGFVLALSLFSATFGGPIGTGSSLENLLDY